MRFICVCCVLLWSSARGMMVLNGTSVEASVNSERAGVDWDQGLETRGKSTRSLCGLPIYDGFFASKYKSNSVPSPPPGGSFSHDSQSEGPQREKPRKFKTRGKDGFLHNDEKTCLKGMCCCCIAHCCNKIPYNAAVDSDPEDERATPSLSRPASNMGGYDYGYPPLQPWNMETGDRGPTTREESKPQVPSSVSRRRLPGLIMDSPPHPADGN